MGIPGTSAHHQLLVNQAQRAVRNDQSEAANEAQNAHLGAEKENLQQKTFDAQHPQPEADEFGTPIATDQGYMQPNKHGGAKPLVDATGKTLQPIEKTQKNPLKEFTDEHGRVWNLSLDENGEAVARPVKKGPQGEQLQGKPTTKPLEDRVVEEYQQHHPGATLSEARRETLPKPPTVNVNAGTAALDRETSRFAKPHEKAVADAGAQLEKIADARSMVNGSAEAQALGIPKVLTALVSGPGSGVRITQPELNSIATARGVKGNFEGWLNSIQGKGKLTSEQQKQLTSILDDVKSRVVQKQQISNEALDNINGAGSREEILQHEKNARAKLAALESGTGSSSPQAQGTGGYEVGKSYQGMKYLGGDPHNAASWSKSNGR